MGQGSWTFPAFNSSVKLGKKQIVVRDITLREGEQVADVAFKQEEKVRIAQAIDDAGVQQIQCGYANSPADVAVVKTLKSHGCKASLELIVVGYSPNWKNDVSAGIESGADIIHFIFRSDDSHLAELGLNHEQAKEKVFEIADFAKSSGAKNVSFGPSFASRADPRFLTSLINEAISGGARYVVISDSTGVMNPEGFGTLVKLVSMSCRATIGVHCHNDFGLALANTLSGIRSGATIAEASLGGFGERAGNTATEELVMALELLYKVDLRIDLKKLSDAVRLVFYISKMTPPPLKPIIGANAFTQKLDIHVMTTRTRPWLHEPFDPALVGAERKLAIGKGSGPIAIGEKAKELSLTIPETRMAEVVKKVAHYAEAKKRALTDDEFIHLVRDTTGA